MALVSPGTDPCWEVVDAHGEHAGEEDGWAHYATEADASERALALNAGHDVASWRPVRSFDAPCVSVVCDVCDEAFDVTESGSTHLDPADPTAWLSECDWIELGGRHLCPDHAPPWCEGCGELVAEVDGDYRCPDCAEGASGG